eukprot:353764-Chlamydomonas_euryale.AAC.2
MEHLLLNQSHHKPLMTQPITNMEHLLLNQSHHEALMTQLLTPFNARYSTDSSTHQSRCERRIPVPFCHHRVPRQKRPKLSPHSALSSSHSARTSTCAPCCAFCRGHVQSWPAKRVVCACRAARRGVQAAAQLWLQVSAPGDTVTVTVAVAVTVTDSGTVTVAAAAAAAAAAVAVTATVTLASGHKPAGCRNSGDPTRLARPCKPHGMKTSPIQVIPRKPKKCCDEQPWSALIGQAN